MREVYRVELGIDLPAVTIPRDLRAIVREFRGPIKSLLTRIPEPEHLCIAEMENHRLGMHVGVYVVTPDGPRILHNIEHSGVVCEPLRSIPYTLTYWKHGTRGLLP